MKGGNDIKRAKGIKGTQRTAIISFFLRRREYLDVFFDTVLILKIILYRIDNTAMLQNIW